MLFSVSLGGCHTYILPGECAIKHYGNELPTVCVHHKQRTPTHISHTVCHMHHTRHIHHTYHHICHTFLT